MATFEDVADTTGQRVLFGREQLFLVAVHAADELIQKVHFGQAAYIVFNLFFALLTALAPTLATLSALTFTGLASAG